MARAREKVDEMQSKSDADGADTGLVAIGTLGTPTTESRH